MVSSMIAPAFYFAGIVLWVLVMRNRSEHAPDMTKIATYSPRNWKPIWYQKHWLTPRGYRYYFIGAISLVAGAAISLLFVYN